MLRYEAPDGSISDDPSPASLRAVVEDSPPEYWQRGGNGEAVISVHGSREMLCIKQPPTTPDYLLTFMDASSYLVPYTGGSLDDFVWEERGGDPFKVPRACLVARSVAADVVVHFAESRCVLPTVNWISWDELPESYHFM